MISAPRRSKLARMAPARHFGNRPMARAWQIESAPTSTPLLTPAAVQHLLGAWDAPDPAHALLGFIDAVVPVAYLSLVEYRRGDMRQVAADAVGSHDVDVARRCYRLFSQRFAHADPASPHVREAQAAGIARPGVTALLYRNEDIPDPAWRRSIFEDHHLRGKFSLIYAPADGQVISLNLYRDADQGEFDEAAAERLLAVAPLVRQVHRHALGLGSRLPAVADRVGPAEQRLMGLGKGLTPRECAVCARIASGMSTEGIALDLGVASSTVVTLRKRGYAKLGVNERLGLARLVY